METGDKDLYGDQKMSLLYIDDDKAKLSVHDHRFRIEYSDGLAREIPMEAIDDITILGNAQLTTRCMQICLKRGIDVSFFSKGGSYFGRLQSTGHVNTERQRLQCELYGTPFAINLARQIVKSKIHNQKVVLSRYAKSKNIDVDEHLKKMEISRGNLDRASSIEEIMGYEGHAARIYFLGAAGVIDPEFIFKGRNRQPPRDPFNSLISLGYSILMNTMYSSIQNRGLNPYFGFLHQDREKHPTLASDLMEEWRAVIVDSMALSLINGHEIHKDHFYTDYDNGACLLTKEGMKIFLNKLENKLQVKTKYLNQVPYSVSFRQAIGLQVDTLIHAMKEKDASLYKPLEVR